MSQDPKLYLEGLPEGTPVAAYGWIIDTDETEPFDSPANDAGRMGPRTIGRDVARLLEDKEANHGHHFKMYDPVDELCYTGRILVNPDAEWGEEFFAPLDDFGKPNVGAVSIHYYNPEKKMWEEL